MCKLYLFYVLIHSWVYYLRERLRVLHRGRRGRGDHRGGGAELRVLAPAAHRARTAGAPIAAVN